MKDPLTRTKVVLRHLPPSISHSALMEQIHANFSGRISWSSFRPGKISQKNQRYSRAYIDFHSPEDAVEFAEFFYGHIFVSEKGLQFKALVEYAPSQRVPKIWDKKDGREGTILKDPEYLEFLELIAKPVENLPSAEIQLERRDAERAGGSKEAIIVTPLMDFIRRKRAAKSGSQRISANGKLSRRVGGAGTSSSSSSKRGSEKGRGSTSMYVLRDYTKTSSSAKHKLTYKLVPKKEDQQLVSASVTEVSEDEAATGTNGNIAIASGSVEIGNRRVVLLKGKDTEPSHVSCGSSQQNSTTSVRNLTCSSPFKQNQRHETNGRIIRSVLSNKDARQSQTDSIQTVNCDRDNRPSRPPYPCLVPKNQSTSTDSDGRKSVDVKIAMNDLQGVITVGDKNDKRTRNKDRPDRRVWAHRPDRPHVNDDASLPSQLLSDVFEDTSAGHIKNVDGYIAFQSAHENTKSDLARSSMNSEFKNLGSGLANNSTQENGVHRSVGRRGPAHGMKKVDSSFPEGKPSKKGGSATYGSQERQVWVQKMGSGS